MKSVRLRAYFTHSTGGSVRSRAGPPCFGQASWRFTWHDRTARPDQVLANIRRVLVDRALFVVCGTTEPVRMRLELAHHVDQLAVTVG